MADSDDTILEAFDTFSEQLMSELRNIFTTLKEYKTITTKQIKLWQEFHCKRSHIIPTFWKTFCQQIGLNYDQLAAQTINLQIFESFMKTYFYTTSTSAVATDFPHQRIAMTSSML